MPDDNLFATTRPFTAQPQSASEPTLTPEQQRLVAAGEALLTNQLIHASGGADAAGDAIDWAERTLPRTEFYKYAKRLSVPGPQSEDTMRELVVRHKSAAQAEQAQAIRASGGYSSCSELEAGSRGDQAAHLARMAKTDMRFLSNTM